MARVERGVIEKARRALFARVSAEMSEPDDETHVEHVLEAESEIDRYLDAVREGSALLPDPQNLAFACALLLVVAKVLEQRDVDLLGWLNAPEIGVSMYAVSGQITEIKERAIAGLEKLDEAARRTATQRSNAPSSGDDVPF